MGTRVNKSSQIDELRAACESSLWTFAQYVNPHYVYGDIHEEVFNWLSSSDAAENQLLLLPRGHLKSHVIATLVAWEITKYPAITCVYLSAGEDLAKDQIYAIKGMMTSDEYRLLWPDMFNEREHDRDKWAADGFNVDHPLRKEMGIRDWTLRVKTVKSNAIGSHCDLLIQDDVVVPEFAYSEIGRKELQRRISQFASIKNPGARTKAVGTTYDARDLYANYKKAEVTKYDLESGEFLGVFPLWDVFERVVEDRGDGEGNFLWPRGVDARTNLAYGFDKHVLAAKRAEYAASYEMAQFYAQYYLNPHDPDSLRVSTESFQYYDPKFIKYNGGQWYYGEHLLRVYAAVDVAWSTSNSSDFTAIVVIGMTADRLIYILHLDKFRTNDLNVHYKNILAVADKWHLKRIKVESNSGGALVAKGLQSHVRQEGRSLIIDSPTTTGKYGKKAERIASFLEPRYQQRAIFHFRGGYTSDLEDELVKERPVHDDLKDALALAVEDAVPPSREESESLYSQYNKVVPILSRFGGRPRSRM